MLIRKLLITAAATAVASSAIAWPGDPPPPSNDCSPGFWKNHTELWFGLACDAECDVWLEQLQAKGPGSSFTRLSRASYLNAWADGYFGATVCKD